MTPATSKNTLVGARDRHQVSGSRRSDRNQSRHGAAFVADHRLHFGRMSTITSLLIMFARLATDFLPALTLRMDLPPLFQSLTFCEQKMGWRALSRQSNARKCFLIYKSVKEQQKCTKPTSGPHCLNVRILDDGFEKSGQLDLSN